MTKLVDKSRRRMIGGGLALGAVAAAALLRPSDNGRNHSDYFLRMSGALAEAQLSKPTLIIDKAALLENISTLNAHVAGNYNYRVVGKSLPSLPLLDLVMKQANTQSLMMFHQPFLTRVAAAMPSADVLMGKPMPVVAAANFYRALKAGSEFDPARQLQWLIDTPERARQYQQLAQQSNQAMRFNIELDVGLHRGGVSDDQALIDILNVIEADPLLSLSGFMGYEPQIASLPGNKAKMVDEAMAIYSHKVTVAEKHLQRDLSDLTLNTAGSPTYRYYKNGDHIANELSAGSCLVKPSDFDKDSLTAHTPASFIATPVLKTSDTLNLPGPAIISKAMSAWNPNRAKTFFSYGGYWKAKPVSPEGISSNPIFGHSTNQEMYNGSKRVTLKTDDWIFFRPTQSEFVFSQFGDIAVYDNGSIIDMWPVLS